MKLKKTTVFSLLLTVLCGCTAQPSIDTNNMLETKTYLYSYDYETEPNEEYEMWFFYNLSLFSTENTYYVKGNFQNYNDNDSYNGYLIELIELTEID